MIRTGLCSITFRKLSVEDIVELVAHAGLDAIEWGGDVHVPHGDLDAAVRARDLCARAGIRTPSYGSYYRLVQSEIDRIPFDRVLETAVALGASAIRVWAGTHGSADATDEYWEHVVDETRRIADLAAGEGRVVAFEFHGNSLTDTNEAASRLLREVDHPSARTYWQPTVGKSEVYRKEGLETVLLWLENLHVFHWRREEGSTVRRPLSEGNVEWIDYIKTAARSGRDHYAFLEFVEKDDPDKFLRDAMTLKEVVRRGSLEL
ncbi:TIM barrel protein [bacterium]|nr:TIM barrel protein [bacterium]